MYPHHFLNILQVFPTWCTHAIAFASCHKWYMSAGNNILGRSASEVLLLFDVEGLSVLFFSSCSRRYLWWSLYTLYLHTCQVRVTVDDSGLCYPFRTLINSLVCWLFPLCFSVLSFSNTRQICESLVTFSVKSVGCIIQCLEKLI